MDDKGQGHAAKYIQSGFEGFVPDFTTNQCGSVTEKLSCKRINQKNVSVFVPDHLIVGCNCLEFDSSVRLNEGKRGQIKFDQLHNNGRQNKENHQV